MCTVFGQMYKSEPNHKYLAVSKGWGKEPRGFNEAYQQISCVESSIHILQLELEKEKELRKIKRENSLPEKW